MRGWRALVLVVSLAAACSNGNGSPDAAGTGGGQGGAGTGGRGGGAGGQAGTAAGGSAATGGRGGAGTGGRGGQAGGATGSGGGGGTGGREFCASLPGTTYLSVTEQECGRGPDGGARCRWSITFTATAFSWRYSDVVETGSYTCAGNTVTGQRPPSGITIVGQYDPATQTLTWNNLAYERQ